MSSQAFKKQRVEAQTFWCCQGCLAWERCKRQGQSAWGANYCKNQWLYLRVVSIGKKHIYVTTWLHESAEHEETFGTPRLFQTVGLTPHHIAAKSLGLSRAFPLDKNGYLKVVIVFPNLSKGFSFHLGVWELRSLDVVFEFATVCNRPPPAETDQYGPAVGESLKSSLLRSLCFIHQVLPSYGGRPWPKFWQGLALLPSQSDQRHSQRNRYDRSPRSSSWHSSATECVGHECVHSKQIGRFLLSKWPRCLLRISGLEQSSLRRELERRRERSETMQVLNKRPRLLHQSITKEALMKKSLFWMLSWTSWSLVQWGTSLGQTPWHWHVEAWSTAPPLLEGFR